MSYIGNQITGFLGTGSLTVTTSTVAVEGDALFSADGNVVLGDASGDTITINAATASIPNNLNIDSNTLFLDASNNRVGIGSASPATALDVAGTITSDGLTVDGSSVLSVDNSSIPTVLELRNDDKTDDNGLRLDFNSLDTSNNDNVFGRIEVEIKNHATEKSNMNFSIRNDSGNLTELFVLDKDEKVIMNGSVGIGTTPSNKLDVLSSGAIVAQFKRDNTGGASGGISVGNNDKLFTLYADNSNGLQIYDGATERMRIDSSGNLLLRQTSGAVYDYNGSGSVASYYGAQFSSAQSTATKTILGNAADGNYMGSATNNSSGNAIINGYVRAVSTVQTAGSEEGILTFATKPSNSSATTRMTIDSSGNTMLAKSSTNTLGTVGHDFGVTGYAMHTRASSNVLYLNRTTSDGNIAEFYKDGSTVGSIYTNAADGGSSSELCIASGNTGLKFDDTNNYIRPTNSAGANRDNIISLGEDDNRFKDLYLSGSVYLGGTGSANALDDYEEGTWTPTWTGRTSNPTISYSTQAGFYTKIGDMVYASFRLTISTVSGGSGFLDLAGLPFNINASSGYFGGMMRIFAAGWSGDAAPLEAHTQPSTSVHMKRMDSLFNSTTCYVTELENSCDLIGTIIYKT